MGEPGEGLLNPEDIVDRDLLLIELKLGLTTRTPATGTQTPQDSEELRGVQRRNSYDEGHRVLDDLMIYYQTKTGRIGAVPRKFRFGDYSRLHTQLAKTPINPLRKPPVFSMEGWHKKILLYFEGEWPTPYQFGSAVAGQQVGHDPEDRKILPERIAPPDEEDTDFPEGMVSTIPEPWGFSKLLIDPPLSHIREYDSREALVAPGDNLVLKAIQKFNERYGPPR